MKALLVRLLYNSYGDRCMPNGGPQEGRRGDDEHVRNILGSPDWFVHPRNSAQNEPADSSSVWSPTVFVAGK